jgi:hypothetical protein
MRSPLGPFRLFPSKLFQALPRDAFRWLICATLVGLFAWSVALCYIPGKGFTYFIGFGERGSERYLPEVRAVGHYEFKDSEGYDGKVYAQIALRPNLGDPVLRHSVGGLAYRARRILFSWIPWVIGAGKPASVLGIYAFQDVAYWLVLALILFHWLPPVSWNNVLRWTAVLFSFGLVFGVRSALPDVPSLLLIAIAFWLLETRRPWLGSIVLGISGLARETNILGAVGLDLPERPGGKAWSTWALKAVVVAAPLGCWTVTMALWIGHGDDVGAGNFSLPFVAFIRTAARDFMALKGQLRAPWSGADYGLLVKLGLLVQFFFFALRIRWLDRWWRLGASYAALMACLGASVWEGYPAAASRVLLPMTLAFNLTVPKSRKWFLVLLLGNIAIAGSADLAEPPGLDTFVIEGPGVLGIYPKTTGAIEADYLPNGWWEAEHSRFDYWRWSKGDATVVIHNSTASAIAADVTFRIKSADARTVTVKLDGRVVWRSAFAYLAFKEVALHNIHLRVGDTLLAFDTDRPAKTISPRDNRPLAFSIWDPKILLGKSP